MMRFNEFIYESKYDTFAQSVSRDLFKIIKGTQGTTVGKILRKELSYAEPVEFTLTFIVKRVKQFIPLKSVHFKQLPWEVMNFERNGFVLDANTYSEPGPNPDEPEIEVILYVSPDAEPLSYDKIYHKMTEYIRHEIEHLLQSGINRRPGHIVRTPQKVRDRHSSSYRYFLLADEIPAMVAGMHAAAVKKRRPLDLEFEEYLRPLVDTEIISEDEFKKVMRTWINFAKKTYPDSIFSDKRY